MEDKTYGGSLMFLEICLGLLGLYAISNVTLSNPTYTSAQASIFIKNAACKEYMHVPPSVFDAIVQEQSKVKKGQPFTKDELLKLMHTAANQYNMSKQTPTSTPVNNRPIIIPLTVAQQTDGVSCGSHSIINTHAVRELTKKGMQLTSENIQKEAKKYASYIQGAELEIYEMDALINFLNMDQTTPLYVLYLKDNALMAGGALIYGNSKYGRDLDHCYATIKNDTTAHASFIINTGNHWKTGGHWFLSEVIKKDGKLEILYLNSTNAPLTPESNAAKVCELLSREVS